MQIVHNLLRIVLSVLYQGAGDIVISADVEQDKEVAQSPALVKDSTLPTLLIMENNPDVMMYFAACLQRGKHLLETSDDTIAEIAYQVGFNTPNYFSDAFWEAFGFRPNAMRN